MIQSDGSQYKSAVLNHSSAPEVSRGRCCEVAAASVPLVNNRKGSLLPRSGDPNQARQWRGAPEEASRLQRAHSLPVKYRYHPGHAGSATLGHKHRKGNHLLLPPRPPLGACGSNRSTNACTRRAAVAACVAFFTNDPPRAAVSCATLNIEQAAQNVKGRRVCADNPPPSGSPLFTTGSILVEPECCTAECEAVYHFRFLLFYLKYIPLLDSKEKCIIDAGGIQGDLSFT